MKNVTKFLAIAMVFFATQAFAQVKIGHININELVELMPERDSAVVKLQNYAKELDETMQGMQQEFNTKLQTYQQKNATWTAAILEAKTKELQEMELDGVEAILSVTPYYNKPSQEGLYRHFEAVAKASPVPVILYNVPGRTGVNMSADTTCRLARNFDNIIAVKEASGKIDQIEQIIKNCPKDFLVLSGDDGMTVDVMRKGGDGVISVAVNAFPKRFSHVVYLAKQGLFDRAEEAYAPLHEAVCALFEQGNPVGVKAALTILNQIENNLRLPLVPATELLMKKMERLIREYELC